MLEHCGRRTLEHGYTISSPCEPEGSGELIKDKQSTVWDRTDSNFERIMSHDRGDSGQTNLYMFLGSNLESFRFIIQM